MQSFSDFYNTDCCRYPIQKTRMLTLEFTENWNGKLFNDHFNELTLYNTDYTPGTIIEVRLNNVSMGLAKIEVIRTLLFSRVTDAVSYINLGKPAHFQAELLNRIHGEGRPLSPDTQLAHLVVGYTQRNLYNQEFLFKSWWNKKNKPNSHESN